MRLLRNVRLIVIGIGLGLFRIKANVYAEDSCRGDQRNLERLDAPSDGSH
jgi:hypothetical protein